MLHHFIHTSRIPAPAAAVFAWHGRPGALERLTPPWESMRVVSRSGGIENGGRVEAVVRLGPLRRRWVAEHRNYEAGRQFQDVQVEGPFADWVHTHRVVPDGPAACLLEDRIEYRPPAGALGRWLGGPIIRRRLARAFAYRHRITRGDVLAHLAQQGAGTMKILVSGRNGLIGSALAPFLTTGGHQVVGLTRSPKSDDDVGWDPAAGTIDTERLEGFDAVVHLAGENIASRWTAAKKARIRDSRVNGTRLLCEALGRLTQPPKVLCCASAIGYYGDRGDEPLTEVSGPGQGFLAEVCKEWEAAADPARDRGIRVVHLRIGVVLTPEGGALAKMLTPFKLGAGGVVGSGNQYWSWIARDDVVGAIGHVLTHDELTGPVNGTAPNPVTNREFTKTLGKVLGRPTIFPMPAFAARLALGEMADELLLGSARVLPKRLEESGYQFRFPDLESALRHVLGK